MHYEELTRKIEGKTAVLGVVGLGYVGLPLAVEMAKVGYTVMGFDVQQGKVDEINRGHNYIGDVEDSDLSGLVQAGKLSAHAGFGLIGECDCVAICVPTPLDGYFQPDISYVRDSAASAAAHAHAGMLIVLESTTYPGTTEEVIQPLFEERGLTIGEDVFLAFSPERVDPGNQTYKTKNIPKVVGGVTPRCTEIAALLYGKVTESSIFKASSPKVAEMEKILENTFRNINVALVNEMAVLCERMGIPVWEVIDAAATKPYGFMPFYPGPGLGGHCIPVDPFYLTWKARAYNYHTKIIEVAGDINRGMPEYCVSRLSQMLNKSRKPLNGSKALVLGIAYKPNINDMRESPALDICRLLRQAGSEVSYNDPFIPEFSNGGQTLASEPLTAGLLNGADIVCIATAHSAYDPRFIVENSRLVFDTRNLTAGIAAGNLERL